MKILLTGVTGYVGKRLLKPLLDSGHTLVCCVRDLEKFDAKEFKSDSVQEVLVDFLNGCTPNANL